MARHKVECIDFYEAEASSYDQKRFACACSRLTDELYRQAVASLLEPERTVLDVGAGTGRFALHLSQQGKRTVALDSSRSMLKAASEKAIIHGLRDRIDLVQGDIEQLPFREASFDGLCSIHVLVHLRDLAQPTSEFSRVLVSDGASVIEIANAPLARLTNKFWRLLNRRPFFSFPDYYHSQKELKESFQTAGLKPVGRRKVRKVPRVLMHLLMCRLNLPIAGSLIRLYERLPYGGVSIVRWQKE